jgi:hypothetical protein
VIPTWWTFRISRSFDMKKIFNRVSAWVPNPCQGTRVPKIKKSSPFDRRTYFERVDPGAQGCFSAHHRTLTEWLEQVFRSLVRIRTHRIFHNFRLCLSYSLCMQFSEIRFSFSQPYAVLNAGMGVACSASHILVTSS